MWREQVLPRLTDAVLRGHEVGQVRGDACTGLTGRVLEIGFGSGLNVRWYPREVTEVHAVEPSDVAWELSAKRRARVDIPIHRTGLEGEQLTAEDAAYDAVLVTFTLCSIPAVDRALAEARRVLRPGGGLHFLEHGIAPDPAVARWQRRLDPVEKLVAGGCHLTRDPEDLVTAAGFGLGPVRHAYLSGPRAIRPWGYLSWARAELD
ncbi:MAG: class I SAM-dependent methyltransferase [Nocardioidaceae bacterium]